MAYPTITEIKTYLDGDGTSEDALLTELLASAKAFIEGPEGCGRSFEPAADSTRTFDCLSEDDGGALRGNTLILDKDLCSITSITNGDGSAVTSSEYVTNPRNETPYHSITLKETSASYWTYSTTIYGCISIVGKWGYSLTAPADIKQACIELVTWMYRRRKDSGEQDRTIYTPDGVTLAPSALPAGVKAVLRAYRKRSL